MTVMAVVLAAGAGSRFRASGATEHKLLVPVRGRPVVAWAIDAALAAGFDELVVVTGAVALPVPAGVRVLHNDRSTEGQATSLALAVERGRTAGHDVLVVGLGDQPFLTPEAWRAVAAAVSLERPLATASYDGVAGQPVAMHSSLWDEIPTTGDAGARSLLSRHRDLLVEVPCTGSPADIDTLEDLARWS